MVIAAALIGLNKRLKISNTDIHQLVKSSLNRWQPALEKESFCEAKKQPARSANLCYRPLHPENRSQHQREARQ